MLATCMGRREITIILLLLQNKTLAYILLCKRYKLLRKHTIVNVNSTLYI